MVEQNSESDDSVNENTNKVVDNKKLTVNIFMLSKLFLPKWLQVVFNISLAAYLLVLFLFDIE